ncbi:hypothetical protein [Microbispora sp. GKU 823]|uniref:hypothetical protein n=1 Tax=Microbispora sp. GKU 823 TaxID=1652100 RepID=UPI0009A42FE8|nr:hypothetical protein B1L11_27075 [Microbispora sp. GKU 823]
MRPVPFAAARRTSVRKALTRVGWAIDDLDTVEINEAFAAQALAFLQDLHLDRDGGAIALGHPLGCSGARILTTLPYRMNRTDARKGLATMCGVAVLVLHD